MKLTDFSYDLPSSLIAGAPAKPRDSARLLGVGEELRDGVVRDLPGWLAPGDLLVVNDTRVIPAQLMAMRGVARVGVTLDREVGAGVWRVLLRNARRVRVGDVLTVDAGFSALVVEVLEGGAAVLRFKGDDFWTAVRRLGALALPPYIARPDGVTGADATDYQTMFAEKDGAVAAPTAGLHFTDGLMTSLAARGVGITRVTLHVGAGTFLPVRVADVRLHRMHAERGILDAAAAAAINETRAQGGRIVPVGTTALRLIETAADTAGVVKPFDGETDIFILPGYRFRVADLLFTNFHLPESTLLMLVSAFAGVRRIRQAYAHAMAASYRFYSYGDACLLERA